MKKYQRQIWLKDSKAIIVDPTERVDEENKKEKEMAKKWTIKNEGNEPCQINRKAQLAYQPLLKTLYCNCHPF